MCRCRLLLTCIDWLIDWLIDYFTRNSRTGLRGGPLVRRCGALNRQGLCRGILGPLQLRPDAERAAGRRLQVGRLRRQRRLRPHTQPQVHRRPLQLQVPGRAAAEKEDKEEETHRRNRGPVEEKSSGPGRTQSAQRAVGPPDRGGQSDPALQVPRRVGLLPNSHLLEEPAAVEGDHGAALSALQTRHWGEPLSTHTDWISQHQHTDTGFI